MNSFLDWKEGKGKGREVEKQRAEHSSLTPGVSQDQVFHFLEKGRGMVVKIRKYHSTRRLQISHL